jgi:Holliday junction DNA helicase RuvB
MDTNEELIESTLRPKNWDNYIGQERIKKHLKVIIDAAKERKESPDHILLYGPAGLGKTTLAYLVAKEAGAEIRTTSGPIIEKSGDLVAILTNLNDGDFLFIDEIHRINRFVEEYLYSAMEEFKLNLILGKGRWLNY